jgi:hypothetical protein
MMLEEVIKLYRFAGISPEQAFTEAGRHREADMHVAVVDVPAVGTFRISAAGKFGHGRMKAPSGFTGKNLHRRRTGTARPYRRSGMLISRPANRRQVGRRGLPFSSWHKGTAPARGLAHAARNRPRSDIFRRRATWPCSVFEQVGWEIYISRQWNDTSCLFPQLEEHCPDVVTAAVRTSRMSRARQSHGLKFGATRAGNQARASATR